MLKFFTTGLDILTNLVSNTAKTTPAETNEIKTNTSLPQTILPTITPQKTELNYTPIPSKQPTKDLLTTINEIREKSNKTKELNYTPIPENFYDKKEEVKTEVKTIEEPKKENNLMYQPPQIITYNVSNPNNANLEESKKQYRTAGALQIGSTLLDIGSSFSYVKDVKATKSQYETQKKLIDTNIANQETLMMENYEDNIAQLDVISAAKNVDLTSSGIKSIKEQGLMDMGKDFALNRTQAELNKAALDLQYKMNVNAARQNRVDTLINGALSIAGAYNKYF